MPKQSIRVEGVAGQLNPRGVVSRSTVMHEFRRMWHELTKDGAAVTRVSMELEVNGEAVNDDQS